MNPSIHSAAFCFVAALCSSLSGQQFRKSRNHALPDLDTTVLAAAAGDVDGDGDLDLVYGCDHEPNELLLGDGRGGFVVATSGRLTTPMPSATWAVTLADLDGDKDLDLVVGNDHFLSNRIHLNDGKGVFTDVTASSLPANADYTVCQAVFDCDGDGDLDLYFGNARGTGQDRLYLNNGKAVFTDVTATHLPASGLGTWTVSVGDFDSDGRKDLLVGRGNGSVVLRNLGGGRFGFWGGLPSVQGQPIVGDFDGDGRDDVLEARRSQLFLQTQAAGFRDVSATHMSAVGTTAWNNHPVDIDLDGDLDVIGPDFVLLNKGKGYFENVTPSRMSGHRDYAICLVADFDMDDDPDLWRSTTFSSREHELVANFHSALETPAPPKTGQSFTIAFESAAGYELSPTGVIPLVSPGPGRLLVRPYGVLGVDPVGIEVGPLVVIPTTGKAAIRLAVPKSPALIGKRVGLQALLFSRRGVRFSNTVLEVIE